jgi:hypothetical protein
MAKQQKTLPDIGSARDFARASGHSESTVYKHLGLGNLASARFGYYHLITRDQFETWENSFSIRRGRPPRSRENKS